MNLKSTCLLIIVPLTLTLAVSAGAARTSGRCPCDWRAETIRINVGLTEFDSCIRQGKTLVFGRQCDAHQGCDPPMLILELSAGKICSIRAERHEHLARYTIPSEADAAACVSDLLALAASRNIRCPGLKHGQDSDQTKAFEHCVQGQLARGVGALEANDVCGRF